MLLPEIHTVSEEREQPTIPSNYALNKRFCVCFPLPDTRKMTKWLHKGTQMNTKEKQTAAGIDVGLYESACENLHYPI